MADPVVSISAASAIGRNFATLNGSITPNATNRAWADGTDSDTEYYFEFEGAVPTGLTAASPFAAEVTAPWLNTATYPPVTSPIKVSGSSPIAIADVAYELTPETEYTVRLVARRILFPGSGSGSAFNRASQPYKLFATTAITFTTL